MKAAVNPHSVRDLLKKGIAQLREAGVPSHTLAAELLLLHCMGCDRTWLYAHPEEDVPAEQRAQFLALVGRRTEGVPTQHLTGKQEFWGLEFEVTPDVLIPRPETEHVIEVALDRLALREVRAGRPNKNYGDGLFIVDAGTGSGCIAIALAKELPRAKFVATDISTAALAVARRNARRHEVSERVQFVETSLLQNVEASAAEERHDALLQGRVPEFDLIVSNPPYVGRREAETLAREVREHEPQRALYGGEEGYELYGELIRQAAKRLKLGGLLVLELGYNSLPAVQPLLDPQNWLNVSVTNDLAGVSRVIAAERATKQL